MRNASFKSWRFRLLILESVALLSVFTFASPPQQVQEPPATAPAAQTSEPEFKLRVQKNVVVVRVVVRDSKGRAVSGLRKGDFRITDKGKLQEISNFSVETSEVAAVPAQPSPAPPPANAVPEAAATPVAPLSYLAFYLDDLFSPRDSLYRATQAAETFIGGLPSTARVAIFTSSGIQSLDFTDDRQKIHEALLKLHKNTRVDPRRALLKDLDAVIQRLAAMPGERQVMLVSDGFVIGDFDFESQRLLERVVDHALRARVTVSALYGAGLAMNMPELDPGLSSAPPAEATLLLHSLDFNREVRATGTLAEIADGTGGQFVYWTNDLLGGMRKALLPPEVSYVLTFSPTKLKADGTFHTLKVTLANGHGLTVQARRGYFAPGKQVSPDGLAKREIREAIFSQDPILDLPLNAQTEVRKLEGKNAEIAVQAQLDVRNLPFEKQGDRNVDKVTFAVGLFDHDGKYISGRQQTYSLSLKDSTRAEMEKRGLIFKTHVVVKAGAYTVRVVVRDSQGGKMAASIKVVQASP